MNAGFLLQLNLYLAMHFDSKGYPRGPSEEEFNSLYNEYLCLKSSMQKLSEDNFRALLMVFIGGVIKQMGTRFLGIRTYGSL